MGRYSVHNRLSIKHISTYIMEGFNQSNIKYTETAEVDMFASPNEQESKGEVGEMNVDADVGETSPDGEVTFKTEFEFPRGERVEKAYYLGTKRPRGGFSLEA